MRILMVLDHEFPPDPRVENEIYSLIKAGHTIHLACLTKKNKPVFEQINGANIHRKPISTFTYKSSIGILKFPFYFIFWKKFLKDLMKEQNFDAIHIHDLPLAKVGYQMSKKYGIKFILDLHENWPSLLATSEHANTFLGKILSSNRQWVKYENKYCNKADYIVTVVEEMKNRIAELGVDSDKIIVLSNTFNLNNRYDIENESTSSKCILYYAGGINKHRGLQNVILGLNEIIKENKNVELWIVGSGKYSDKLKKLVTDNNLDNYVKFYGQKSFNETMNLLRMADIALIPHLKSVQTDNSSPNKLFQYMYFQKPVIVSNCNSLKRVVDKIKCGVSFEFDKPESFASAFSYLVNSDSLESYGKNGRESVLNEFNWENSVKHLIEIYNSEI
jgi:glycosyltransferase involved in cell wall biosynthesis